MKFWQGFLFKQKIFVMIPQPAVLLAVFFFSRYVDEGLCFSAARGTLLRFKKAKWVVTGGTVSEAWPESLSANYAAAFQIAPATVYRRNE